MGPLYWTTSYNSYIVTSVHHLCMFALAHSSPFSLASIACICPSLWVLHCDLGCLHPDFTRIIPLGILAKYANKLLSYRQEHPQETPSCRKDEKTSVGLFLINVQTSPTSTGLAQAGKVKRQCTNIDVRASMLWNSKQNRELSGLSRRLGSDPNHLLQ